MKKILLLFFVAMLGMSCEYDWQDDYEARMWFVYNGTEQTLIFKCPYPGKGKGISFYPIIPENIAYKEFMVAPHSRVLTSSDGATVYSICCGMIPKESNPWFDYYFTQSAKALGEDVSWQILSEGGVALKTWKYSDKGLPDQRFFDESEWLETQSGLWRYAVMFTITPDDIN